MKQILLNGWRIAYGHPLLVIMFYLYHFIWGFFLFRLIRSVVVPVLQRYPADALSPADLKLYWLEFHFRLTKTDMIEPYLWGLGAIVLLRMVLTPILHSGLYYTFHLTGQRRRRAFRKGVKRFGKIFTMYYLLKMLLTVIPLYWLIPYWFAQLQAHYELTSFMSAIWLTLSLYLLYLIVLKLVFMYNQFRLMTETDLLKGILSISSISHRIAGVSAGIFVFLAGASLIYLLATWFWAGLLAVVLYQFYHLIRVLFRFWEIGSHYELWKANQPQ